MKEVKLKVEYVPIESVKKYRNNAKLHPPEQIEQIKKSIEQFGMDDPIGIWKDEIVEGHGRLIACKQLGYTEVPIIRLDHLTNEERKAYTLAHNKLTMNSDFDLDILQEELGNFDTIDMSDFGFDIDLDLNEEQEIIEDEVPEVPEEPKAKLGDIYQLGNHRLMCGDSTSEEDVAKLMNGVKADMVFTDPPYGMKKENDGVANDNLNYDDLLEFNKKWIPITFNNLKDNGSWYCWGIDEPLMDIYSNILKPMQKQNKITFRNLITWNKSYLKNGNTFNPFGASGSDNLRSYPTADEKCLFVQVGIQCLTLNADQYWEEYEPIRKYLYDERIKCGWDIPTMKTIAGHSDKSRDHWTSKSQWNLPTKDVYIKFQNWAKEHNIEAFTKEYEKLREEYEKLRAYFTNADESNNVWNIEITKGQEKEDAGGHATPKPIELCSRAIKSSSRENENVLDVFGGSGSTLIACEQNNRNCYVMELEPKWVDVIIQRWENFTGKKAIKL